MQNNSNYTFEVSLSVESYHDKVISGAMIGTTKNEENRRIRKEYGFASNKGIGFKRTTVTSEELLTSLLDGKVFCHLFNPTSVRKDGTFGSSQKKDVNFHGSYVIGVDIDHTSYSSVEDFTSKLSLQPTFYYTSYSNMQKNEDGSSKGARFRLIYVFDEKINNPYFFRYCSWNLNRIIEHDTDELITDDCNLRCSQYFNGTCRHNKEVILSYGVSDTIYSFSDIDVSDNGFIDFLCDYAKYKTINKSRTEEIKSILFQCSKKHYSFNKSIKKFELSEQKISSSINDKTENQGQWDLLNLQSVPADNSVFSSTMNVILNDWDRLDIEEFKKCSEWERMRNRTKYVYRIEKDDWINNLYQYVDDDYFSMYYYTSTVQDGSKRRKSLYQRMCLRRVINPNITMDEVAVNTIIDIIRFFDNSDKVLNSDFIRKNVESAFNLEIEDIEKQYADSIKYLRDNTKPKRGIIYINKEAHSKQTTYYILDELFDSSISVTENLDYINNVLNYKVGKTTIYEYLNNRKIKPINGTIADEELYDLIDVNLSIRKNLEFLKDNDIKVSKDRVSKILKNKKNNIDNNISSNSFPSISSLLPSSSINDRTEKEGQSISDLINTSDSIFEGQINNKVDIGFNFKIPSLEKTYKDETVEELDYSSLNGMTFKFEVPQFAGFTI